MKSTKAVVTFCVLLVVQHLAAQTSMLDLSFGSGGTVRDSINGGGGFDDRVFAIAIQSDGKIVVAGRSEAPTALHWTFALARFDTDGTLDNTFGTGGTVRTYINGGQNTDDEATDLLIQPNGYIVAGGFTYISLSTGVQFALARYDANGNLDNNFGSSGGTVRTPVGGVDGLAQSNAIARQSDGKIVMAGFCEAPPGHRTFALARFTADGSLDGSFGSGGTLRGVFNTLSGGSSSAQAIAVQTDGKIVIAGTSPPGYTFAVARFDSSGNPDSTFGVNGVATTTITGGSGTFDLLLALALQPDGRIVLAGESQDTLSHVTFAVARLNANGTMDNTFGTNGSARNSVSGPNLGNCFGTSVALQPDGKIVMAGTSYDSAGNAAFAVMRFDSTGKPDNTFGINGTTRNAIAGGGGTDDAASSVGVLADGRIVAAGMSTGPNDHPGTALAVSRYIKENPPSGVATGGFTAPAHFSLSQNYPNPFNPSTTIRYRIAEPGLVKLTVYTMLGQEVERLVNEVQRAGDYTVRFGGSGLSTGVYIYRLVTGKFTESKAMLLLK